MLTGIKTILQTDYIKYIAGAIIFSGAMVYDNYRVTKKFNNLSPNHKLVIIRQPWLCPINKIKIYKVNEDLLRDCGGNYRMALNAGHKSFINDSMLISKFSIWALPCIIPWTTEWQLHVYGTVYKGFIVVNQES